MIMNFSKLTKFITTNKRLPSIREIGKYFNIKKQKMWLPETIQLEVTTRCNLDCIMCSRKKLSFSRLNKDLDLNDFKLIIKKIPSIKKIRLQGLGEPFLNPHLDKILKFGRQKKISFETITNGSLICSKSKELLPLFDNIIISLDSTNKENFESIRKRANYELILKNLYYISALKRKEKWKTKIAINSVITHLNYKEIPSLVDLALSLKLDYISFVEVENWTIPKEKSFSIEKKFINKAREKSSQIRKMVREAEEKYPSSIGINFLSAEKRKLKCWWPFYSTYITVDGYITPCCIRGNPEVFNFGSVFKDNFLEIWNGEKYQKFRNSLIENTPNFVCDCCPD